MRSEKEVYDIVLNFAKTDKRIRMVTLELSLIHILLNSGLAAIHRLYYMFAKERGIFFDAKPNARYHNGA